MKINLLDEKVYLIGSFTNPDWREDFSEKFPNTKWINPKNNPQDSMAKVVFSDLEASKNNHSLCYIPKGKDSVGTTSYSELGAARASGKAIISVDESGREEKEKILEQISSYYFFNKKDSFNFLEKEVIKSKYPKIISNRNPIEKDHYENVYFAGNLDSEEMWDINIKLRKKGKNISSGLNPNQLEEFKENDMLVVNFDYQKPYDKKALYFMGAAFALSIPTLLIDGNPANYPTLPSMARRTFHGEKKFEMANFYFDLLESLRINDEALVYYKLMNKFNK